MLSTRHQSIRTIVFLCLLFCTLASSFIVLPTKAATSTTKAKYSGNYAYAYRVLLLVNKERSKVGAPALSLDKTLLDAAMLRAHEITEVFDHIRPDGTTCFSAAPGKMYAENIAWGYSSPEDVVDGWMNSSGHKKNMLNASYRSIGIGCYKYNGSYYWVQCFGYDTAEAPTLPGTWEKSDNKWMFARTDGSYAKGWEKVDGFWYYFDENSYMKTGWVKSNNIWYYMRPSGEMATGWVKHNGCWYYMDANGAMATGWIKDNGYWYYLDANGIMKTGWIKQNGKWYYCNASGEMQKGWIKSNNNWYYLYNDGSLATNTTIDGFRVDETGAWIQ